MAGEVIDTAFVEIRPLLAPGFAATAEAGVAASLGTVGTGSVKALSGGLNTVSVANERVVLTGREAAAAFSGMGVAATESAGAVQASLAETTVSVEAAARAQIAAAVKERAELELLAAEYAKVATAATASAAEQAAAAALAARTGARAAAAGAASAAAGAGGGAAGAAAAAGIGSKFAKGFIGVTIAALGVEKLAGFLREASDEAGQLQKAQEGVNLTFGESSGRVLEFAQHTKEIGINVKNSEQLSVRIGILAHNLGIGQAKAADMTVDLQKLGGSIASIRGLDPDTVLGNLPQVLAGNLRSLKQLGFAFSATQIHQEAVRQGVIGLNDALTPGAKALGIYGLLVQKAGFYEKEAAKHSGDLTTEQRRLAATQDDLKESIGGLVQAPLAKLTGGLADAENASIKFVDGLKQNKTLMGAFGGFFDAIGDALKGMGEGLRIAGVLARPVLLLLGVALVVSLKAATLAIRATTGVLGLMQKAFKFTAGIVITAIDKFLGAFSSLADVVNKVLPGNPLGGVSDKIDLAREKLRSFKDDLQGVDGTNVKASVTVDVQFGKLLGLSDFEKSIQTAVTPKVKTALGGGGFVPPGSDPHATPLAVNLPPIIAAKEQRLQDALALAQAKDEATANDKKALQELIAFYTEEANNVRLSLAIRRSFRVKRAQAEAEIRALDQADATASSQAAKDATAAAQQKADAAVQERQGFLQANLQLAQTTQNTLRDDIAAERGLIAFFKARVAILKSTTAAGRSALAEQRTEENNLKALLAQQAATTLAAREDALKDNLTLAGFTKGTGDDRRALTALEKFYAARVAASKKGSVARRKWKIELERTRSEIDALDEEQKKTKEKEVSFAQQSFSFLTTQQGFAANLASNLIGDTSGLVGGRTPAAVLPTAAAAPLPTPHGIQAEAARADNGRQPSGGQLDTLIALTREQLTQLRLLRGLSGHPEAGESKTLMRNPPVGFSW